MNSKNTRWVYLFCIAIVFSGYVAPRAYFKDRLWDSGDIVTLTTGIGLGAQVRTGPAHVGCLKYNVDRYGWRNGWPKIAKIDVFYFYTVDWTFLTTDLNVTGEERGKGFKIVGGFVDATDPKPWAVGLPFLSSLEYGGDPEFNPLFHPYYSQAEVCLGLLGSMRAGINPGEFVDFLLGWVGIDFFDDDIELEKIRNPKTEADKDSPGISSPLDMNSLTPPSISTPREEIRSNQKTGFSTASSPSLSSVCGAACW
jgi:hypothetical protein